MADRNRDLHTHVVRRKGSLNYSSRSDARLPQHIMNTASGFCCPSIACVGASVWERA